MQSTDRSRLADRPNLGPGLTDRLYQLIDSGRLADGARINEVHLSRELGVSRTPLREALINLSAGGIVDSQPRRGYFVAPLDADEVADLYAMRALLDPEALALAGLPPARQLEQLHSLNRKLQTARGAGRIVELDNQWHRQLISHCPNQVLLRTIEQFIVLTRRYEHAYFRESVHADVAFEEHDRIVSALEARELDTACTLLRQNMQSAVGPLQEWVRNRRTARS